MYDTHDWGRTSHHIDHVFPRAMLKRDQLVKRGIPADQAEKFAAAVDRLGNLQLLLGRENVEKGAKEFGAWIETRDPSFLQRHCIPQDRSLWRVERFLDFVAEREGLIERRIRELHFQSDLERLPA